MSEKFRDLSVLCNKLINTIPDSDENKETFKKHINSIIRTYLYSAPEVKINSWFDVQNLLEKLYPINHPKFNDLIKIWNEND